MFRLLSAAAVAVAALLLSACGSAQSAEPAAPIAGMCAPEVPDCEDTIVVDEGQDSFDSEQARENARATLGLSEDELESGVRVGRRGEEHMALTEDYVLGRLTVELDADADGVYRVTAVKVELPEGPETFTE